MPALGITGGIATGKSTFTTFLLQELRGELFDADRCAWELLATDPEIRNAVVEAFGHAICNDAGEPDRLRLRELVFADQHARQRLESILHPAIRARWAPLAARAKTTTAWLIVDIPLLYETGAETHFDCVAVVACSPAVQRHRLENERGLTPLLTGQILAAQLPLLTKMTKADHAIWNDSTRACLQRQATFLAAVLRQRYG